jgi:predicted ATPase
VQLIGREPEVEEIRSRLRAGRRLVTVVGPGGIGKTALARVVSVQHRTAVGHESAAVELGRVDRPAAVPGALAAALGFPAFDVALSAPPERPTLVFVDNCEHLAEAAADAIERLLEAWSSATVLATSRTPLAVPGESVIALEPLAVPAAGALDARTGAVLLFCERARDSGVEVDDGDLDAVIELCRRLDGMPLAIELAAARLRARGVAELVRGVRQGVDLLARQRHRGDARHRSVHDTVVWSIRLLDDPDREALRALAVAVGPFDLATAAALIGCSMDDAANALERLVDASLVVVTHVRAGTRYRMLEPIRAVALDELQQAGRLPALRERLAGHVFSEGLAMVSDVRDRWDDDVLPTLISRFDQIDVAVRHCLEHDGDPRRALLLYALLWGVVHQARVDDVAELGATVVARWPDPALRHGADAAATYAMSLLLDGQTNAATSVATAALPHTAESVMAAPNLRRVLALAARGRGDHAAAEGLLADAAELAARSGISTIDLECRTYRAQDLAELGRSAEALEIVRSVAESARQRGSILNEVWARTVEASILALDGAHEEAMEVASATLLVSQAIGYPFGISSNLQTLATGHLAAGDRAAAADTAAALFDAVERSGGGDFRRALDVCAAVLADAGHAGAGPLAASAQRLPDTNPMTVHLPPIARAHGSTSALDRPAATRLARRALADLREAMDVGAAAPPQTTRPASGRFARVGDVWEITFDGLTVHLAATRGMDDLALLLVRPGHEIHCLELAGAGSVDRDAGEVIDVRARREYEMRIRELQGDIDEADADHDIARAERARAELDAIVDHLTKALGLAGRSRRQGGTTERARSAVTHRIRSAIRRVSTAHPPLGRHLTAAVSTGTYCRYQPDPPVTWTV